MYVLRASIVDVNDGEICSRFHDIRVASQHAEEETQDHANDERPTGKMVFEELFCESMDDEHEMLTTDGELHTRHRPRSVANHRETAGDEEQARDEHEERTKGKP